VTYFLKLAREVLVAIFVGPVGRHADEDDQELE